MNSAMDISASALTAHRLRMEVAAHNMANSQTVGYKRQSVELAANKLPTFDELLEGEKGGGVRVTGVTEKETPFTLKLDPSNPAADKNGYIKVPQSDPIADMVDLMESVRAYEANLAAIDATRSIAQQSLSIGK